MVDIMSVDRRVMNAVRESRKMRVSMGIMAKGMI